MKAIAPNLFVRGQSSRIYPRRRIPTALLEAYPRKKTHIVVCLGTSDVKRAKELKNIEEVRIDAEFSRLKEELKAKATLKKRVKLSKLSLLPQTNRWQHARADSSVPSSPRFA